MDFLIEATKIAVSAAVGFFGGRYQAKHGSKATRVRELQKEIAKLARDTCDEAIEHFIGADSKVEVRAVRAACLKRQMQCLVTDATVLVELLNLPVSTFLPSYISFFDAVSTYPFEAGELPLEGLPDRQQPIVSACEEFVAVISRLQ